VTRAFLGLGSNLGDRRANLAAACEALDWGPVRVTARSRVYETDPVGGPPDQPSFYNQVIAIETSLSARELWERCTAAEAALGRARSRAQRWGPRVIDIDLLLFGDDVIDDSDLVVPHPRMHERSFVLVPLIDIAPDVVIPGRGRAGDLPSAMPSPRARAVDPT
jgi:2-amino-4-hydroxy-6-hydroxymethyldihydropteridine diphosphokinase